MNCNADPANVRTMAIRAIRERFAQLGGVKVDGFATTLDKNLYPGFQSACLEDFKKGRGKERVDKGTYEMKR